MGRETGDRRDGGRAARGRRGNSAFPSVSFGERAVQLRNRLYSLQNGNGTENITENTEGTNFPGNFILISLSHFFLFLSFSQYFS